MANISKIDSRKKILNAALIEFSDKGYHGARVAQIAKRAGVSQALLYYNFHSKEAIFNEITDEFIQSLVKHIANTYLINVGTDGPEEFKDTEYSSSFNYVLGKRREISLLLLQALQKGQGHKWLYSMWNEVNQKTRAQLFANRGFKADRMEEFTNKVVDYFFIFMPIMMYGALGEEWVKENGGSIEETNQALITAFNMIADSYWK